MSLGSLKAHAGVLWRTAGRRLYIGSSAERQVVDSFRRLYLESQVDTCWMGEFTPTPPTDLWSYQEIFHDTRPELIAARATPNAGYLRTLCRIAGRGEVFAWDGDDKTEDGERLEALTDLARGKSSLMVVLGSCDGHAHLPFQLRRLGGLVTAGNYLIVEDTAPERTHSDPAGVIKEFVGEDASFMVDRTPEKFYLTFNPGGYLRRQGSTWPGRSTGNVWNG
ncbi:MAG: cephalosporin hydroxylase family protein [Actinomycetota bacterium]|nr:cephalosporin hydroxylase family protein [Actinomycetota bacterium]